MSHGLNLKNVAGGQFFIVTGLFFARGLLWPNFAWQVLQFSHMACIYGK